MGKAVLYAYVDDCDLQDVAENLEERFDAFVSSREWNAGQAWVVNQRHGQRGCARDEDLELWDLGINLRLPDCEGKKIEWRADIEIIAKFLAGLYQDFGREFVIGIKDSGKGISEDLFFICSPDPDLQALKLTIGIC